MRLLRRGGQFTDGRIRFYLFMSLGLFVLVLMIWAFSLHFQASQTGFFAIAFVLVLFKASFRHWQRWFLGKKGESKVTQTLKSLPDDYVVLNDLVLPGNKGNVDHLLIGPNGVFAIETKNYSGFVKCEEEQWFVNGHRIRSLSKQARRNSMAVRGCIGSLFTGPQTRIPCVAPLLVFVNSRARLKLFKPAVSVLRLGELVEFIRDYETKPPITPDEKRAIVHHLQSLQPTFRELADHGAIANDDLYGVT
jgi:Nuclease-related domain